MTRTVYIYNTLSRRKEEFVPVHPGLVGIYVCGPTVYGEPHLGHARPAVTYDVLVRFFRYLGYKVRYVRNITDVGHLEHDADEGDDKIAKKARLESLEPMEVAQTYTIAYHDAMRRLNTLPPSIEPRASGHIIEQIELVKRILDAGFAYESNGSVYFDVPAYNKKYRYGILSGRNIEEMMANTRSLDGIGDKHSPYDFALWKKASPQHIMKWPSPWSDGFPGWHLECSAMSWKYLGEEFDIHGGGMDLQFPHHECELAQNTASRGQGGVKYWMHNNLLTVNGQKMGKSLGNFTTLGDLYRIYSPMTVRFFILQAHYRGTLDFSNDALAAAEKGLRRVLQAVKDFKVLKHAAGELSSEVGKIREGVMEALCDDLNTPVALAHIFDAVRLVNQVKDGAARLSDEDYEALSEVLCRIVPDVLGLVDEVQVSSEEKTVAGLMDMILEVRRDAKARKDFAVSDRIRDRLKELGVTVKDTKEGTEWTL